MDEPNIIESSPTTEQVKILINSETGEYIIEAGMVRLSHLYSVLKDIIERMENNEFSDGSNPDLRVYPIEDEGDILS